MLADYPDVAGQIDGGLQAVTVYLVRELSKLPDIDLHVIEFKQGVVQPLVRRIDGFHLHTLPLARLGTLTGFCRDQQTLNACLARISPTVVHSQGGGHHGIIAARSGLPTVVTIHGIHSREAAFLPGIHRRLRARLEGWIGKQVYIKRARHTILISPYVADHYRGDLVGRTHLIPNPVDEQFFQVERENISNTILFAGRLYALKGVKDLVRAVSKLKKKDNLRVVLAGASKDERYLVELKGMITSLGLEDIVEIPGILEMQDMLQELSHCLCLVLPSYQETAPMVIEEAMAAGVPVIATNICGIPYQVQDGETGFLFPPGDVDLLARNLDRLLSSRDLCEQLGILARQRASEEFRASIIARRTLDVYLEIAKEQTFHEKPVS